jgi:hypothetical protein
MKRSQLLRHLATAIIAVVFASPPVVAAGEADVPYVPTPQVVVDEMLQMARVGKDDYVVDLGSGDGRIVITAAKKHGARGFGVEIDGNLVNAARREAQRQGVAGQAEFVERNLFITDFSRATVLTLYLFPRIIMQLRPRLLAELSPGTRVVSHDFDMGGWRPDDHKKISVPDKPYGPPSSEIYLWIVPANAAGTWQWRLDVGGTPVNYELALDQAFQMLSGKPVAGGKVAQIEGARMRGEEIRFMLTAEVGGREVRHEFAGRVAGDTITGRVRTGDVEAEWKAARSKRGSITSGEQ